MSYSRNFGMRSFENVIRDGRFRVPKTGTALVIGAPVILDGATPGFLKAATAAAGANSAGGLVVFEHIQVKGVDPVTTTTSDAPFNQVPLGNYAQLVHGVGVKVWFKNTAAKTLYDGTTQAAGSRISGDLTAIAVGDGLVPDGAGKLRKAVETPTIVAGNITALGEARWFTVEQVNALTTSTGSVEARFEF